jgi:hypothetical protein
MKPRGNLYLIMARVIPNSDKVDLHCWTSEVFLVVHGGPMSLSTTLVATLVKIDLHS